MGQRSFNNPAKMPWVINQGKKRLSRSEMQANLRAFAARWREILDKPDVVQANVEQQYAQTYWSDLFACFGVDAALAGVYEKYAEKASTGARGRIDMFWPSVMIGEAKSPNVDLEAAYTQALDYLAGGSIDQAQVPRYIVCHNFEKLRIIRISGERFDVEFPLADIPNYVDNLKFLAGYDTVTHQEQVEASVQASRLMTDLFTAMVGDDVDEAVGDEAPTTVHDEDVAVFESSSFLSRVLFCLFAEDAGLFESGLFTRFVEEECHPGNLGSQLTALFAVLDTPEERRRNVSGLLAEFPYVNGHLFDGVLPTQFFSEKMYEALRAATHFDWSRISPAIFGSLFQLVKSKEARRSDGEHYTSEKNILKVLEPLFLDEFRAEADRLIALKGSTTSKIKQLRDFQNRLASYVFCDPACGSGNFLVVAYRELRKIETDLIVAIRELEGEQTMVWDISLEQKVSIGQFHGFELNWWPARIAETAMFLVDHQANVELASRIGMAPERLPISIAAHIIHVNALDFDWRMVLPAAPMTYIFGNPPFVGQKEKADDPRKVADMKRVWGSDYDGYLDYVTGWYAQAVALLRNRPGEFAYVSTNSITQGQPVPALFAPLTREGWRLKFAHRTFVWDSEAPGKAVVHCVILGFTRDRGVKQRLWDYKRVDGEPVAVQLEHGINPYLVDGPFLLVEKRTKALSSAVPSIRSGSKAVDWGLYTFETEADAQSVVAGDQLAARYLRQYFGGEELISGTPRWVLWLKDASAGDIQRSKVLKERVEAVAELRGGSQRPATKKAALTPHVFGEERQPAERYLAIPQTFSERRKYATVDWLDADVIASIKLFTADDPDGYLFGIMSSSMFLTWQLTVGGRMKSDPSFSSTIVWNNLPLPEISEDQRQRIIKAGQGVLAARELHPERSLAEHYNPLAMDPALVKAHDALDREVDKAFGAARKLTTERQRQELLFENYAALVREARK